MSLRTRMLALFVGLGVLPLLALGVNAIAAKADWKAGEIRTRVFQHTYCAACYQTLDR